MSWQSFWTAYFMVMIVATSVLAVALTFFVGLGHVIKYLSRLHNETP